MGFHQLFLIFCLMLKYYYLMKNPYFANHLQYFVLRNLHLEVSHLLLLLHIYQHKIHHILLPTCIHHLELKNPMNHYYNPNLFWHMFHLPVSIQIDFLLKYNYLQFLLLYHILPLLEHLLVLYIYFDHLCYLKLLHLNSLFHLHNKILLVLVLCYFLHQLLLLHWLFLLLFLLYFHLLFVHNLVLF